GVDCAERLASAKDRSRRRTAEDTECVAEAYPQEMLLGRRGGCQGKCTRFGSCLLDGRGSPSAAPEPLQYLHWDGGRQDPSVLPASAGRAPADRRTTGMIEARFCPLTHAAWQANRNPALGESPWSTCFPSGSVARPCCRSPC